MKTSWGSMGSEPLRFQTLTTIWKILKKYNCLENHYRNISIVNGMNPYHDIQIEANTFLVDISGIVDHHRLSFQFIPNEARV
jgi:hypothetical protein